MTDRSQDLKLLVSMLLDEQVGRDNSRAKLQMESASEDELFRMFRNLVNTREPAKAPDGFLEVQDRMLKGVIEDAGITDASTLSRVPCDERISLWRGDITTLKADAIVNAANSQMLGCWVPGHYCIDNAIHTFAGIQLRRECYEMMMEQRYEEPTGQAKITDAYNLPAEHVIHTVGPIANGRPTQEDARLLASSYISCLDEAAKNGCGSIAFCCISTGVFGFPQKEAADIAVSTVRNWLDEHNSNMHVIFNVFSEKDEELYHELLFNKCI